MHPQEFTHTALETFQDDIFRPGGRIFVPACPEIHTHERVRRHIFDLCPRAVVVVLNGEEKSLVWHARSRETRSVEASETTARTLDLRKFTLEKAVKADRSEEPRPPPQQAPLEVSDKIALAMERYGLEDRPLLITGYICVGMGQTLLNAQKMGNFTHAILPSREGMRNLFMKTTPEVLYQEAGRVTGRKHQNRTQILCPPSIRDNFVREEQKAIAVMDHARGGDPHPVLRLRQEKP
ncbi:unnamed protein product [Amoebophrya sp. A25]|nr:unnamed protein product [Amoebophrya sp. A25]|eukprot:GSA25T00004276001.1